MRTGPATTEGCYDPDAAKAIAAGVEPSRLRWFTQHEAHQTPGRGYQNACFAAAMADLRGNLTADQIFVLTECVRAPSGLYAEKEHTNPYVGARTYVVCEQFRAAGLIADVHMKGAGRVAYGYLFAPLLASLVIELDRQAVAA